MITDEPEGSEQQTFLLCEVCDTFGKSPKMLMCKKCGDAYHIPCVQFDTKATQYEGRWGNWRCPSCSRAKQATKWNSENPNLSSREKSRIRSRVGETPIPQREREWMAVPYHYEPATRALEHKIDSRTNIGEGSHEKSDVQMHLADRMKQPYSLVQKGQSDRDIPPSGTMRAPIATMQTPIRSG
jgi:hypothetical protein